ncbi:MAG: hypothetical protein HWN81_00370 [Candidatus Lokiarchaeota archaeon]|nr:hypothetical protein [Candidatus Lokiarchaeota archaeon]
MKKLCDVVISADDTEVITTFYDRFGFTMPNDLKEAINAFKEKQTLFTQRDLIKQLTIGLVNIKDETFIKLFSQVLEGCKKTACQLQFEDDIDEMLTADNNKQEE